ncbi:DNA repair protein RAD57 [Phlyctema vagabunda]|uniref:DNA repair protein RAD57 n=1 Tax=Phlyctema vagabunda TaxID=108571 RepID=A0ABR4P5Y2_9HELO
MTDLSTVLPHFATQKYVRLLPSLERHHVTTADLITLDAVEVAKRAHLPVLDVKRLCTAVLEALQTSLGLEPVSVEGEEKKEQKPESSKYGKTGEQALSRWQTISTLDDQIDQALGGGVPTGYITEVTGESGAGKTQFLLTLLLAVQLQAPYGLASSALYISTESALPTTRLSQLLRNHPLLLSAESKPTLDAVHSIVTPDLESQDHILRFQVPVAIQQYGIRLIILDSVAANYRAEFERPGGTGSGGANMAQRSGDLIKLGQLLRDLARDYDIAIVVANQVADRFTISGERSPVAVRATQSSPLAHRGTGGRGYGNGGRGGTENPPSSSMAAPPSSMLAPALSSFIDHMSLDHQQRWFTGWGDAMHEYSSNNMKTPSLGLIWTTQIACRIALIKKPVYGRALVAEEEGERGEAILKRWRRYLKVVFAPHARPSGAGITGAVEFEIAGRGIVALREKDRKDDDEAAFG